MDNYRILLFAALSVVILLLWQAWQQDFGAPQTPTVATTGPGATPAVPSVSPAATTSTAPAPAPGVPAATVAPAVQAAALKSAQRVHVKTDVLDVYIDTIGGDLRQADLLTYPVKVDKPNEPVRLLTDAQADLFIAQSGLLSSRAAPDYQAQFSAEQTEYTLGASGVSEIKVPLSWTGPDGVTVTKIYTFHRGSYVVDVEQVVNNASAAEWKGRQYRQFQRRDSSDGGMSLIYTYTGGVIYSEAKKYEKIQFDDMAAENLSRDVPGGWAAMIQHYFLGAWIPKAGEANHYYSQALDDKRYVLGMASPEMAIAPGQSGSFSSRLFIGPKLQDTLEKVAPGLELTVDYGILTVLAKPLFWLLEWLHKMVGNWGWSIVLVTLMIKLVFFKLSETSYRSMANMRRLQPKMTALKERHGEDRQKFSQAMMELYKKEKVNPMGGCLPILVQIPVFIALYWMLLESVELRQAPFILWIHDLSTRDPFYVLPLLMGATMFIQQKLNPPPPDPVMAKMMKFLPFIFTPFFAFFPAGLVLYWVVNNVLSIAQQWYITRRIEQQVAKAA
ncbi:MAG: membrane protein insertase YidC [Gammaproteobacteria bacterium]|nr:membrane protein insertase YidC [Gammaproteobacteria bacterium]